MKKNNRRFYEVSPITPREISGVEKKGVTNPIYTVKLNLFYQTLSIPTIKPH